ncbi:MAG: serine protease [Ignavibacteriaceae bacterium]|nr:serine protease [Ignavibacteriaceae bacterium]
MLNKTILSLLFIFFCLLNMVYAQEINWFANSTINAVTLIQKKVQNTFVNHGVGILFSPTNNNRAIIATCEHLTRGKEFYVVVDADTNFLKIMANIHKSYLIINETTWEIDGNQLKTKITLIKDSTYVTHPDTSLDIAAFPIDLSSYVRLHDSTKILCTETTFVGTRNIGNKKMIRLGEDVYFVGFPFGIGTQFTLEPLVRSGIVSWVSEKSKVYLLDAFSYGGNSGSPIFTKMSSLSEERNKPFLIGMVIGHLGIENENFGLARCVSIEDIITVVEKAKKLK